MKIINFLFYSLYKGFSTIKRENVRNEDIIYPFLGLLLSTNTIMLFFSLKFIFGKETFTSNVPNLLLKLFFAGTFFAWYFFCKKYYFKNKNDAKVIKYYSNRFPFSSNKFVFIGILYTLGTFISFIYFAAILSRIN